MPTPAWKDRAVLVTGASAGLGRAIAEAFAEQGASVAIAARRLEPLEAAAKGMQSRGLKVTAIQCDVTQTAEVERMVETAVRQFGRLDVLVNNAGRSARGAVLDATPEDFADLIDINLLATVRATRAAAPHLLATRGHVVNISSLGGKAAGRYLGAYCAAKHALSGYSQQLRLELSSQGLHVLLVSPGPLDRDEVRTYGAEDMANVPEAARRPGGGVKTKRIDPAWLANRITLACQRREPELVVPAKARLLFAIMQLSPKLGDLLIRKMT
jgi:NAD(P)-dependent dehydrogenase (short-subunit alcohol dehydrogenase family)